MKAFYARSYGGPGVMLFGELPEPAPRRGEVIVAVRASSVNPVDWKVRRGDMRFITGRTFPRVIGSDFAGVVKSAGAGATGFIPGDPVYGYVPIMFGRQGAHAELTAVGERYLRHLPDGIGFEQAAALPVAALTALNGLRQCGDLSGRSVAVIGATGGVGHFAVQMAKARGASVTAVCSGRNTDFARSLGADRVIDYQKQELTAVNDRFDVVFDAYAHGGFTAAAGMLAPRGYYATTLPGPGIIVRSLVQKLMGGPAVVFANMRARQEDFSALEQLIASGSVKPVIGRIFPLEQAAAAFAAQESGGTPGKVVIRIS